MGYRQERRRREAAKRLELVESFRLQYCSACEAHQCHLAQDRNGRLLPTFKGCPTTSDADRHRALDEFQGVLQELGDDFPDCELVPHQGSAVPAVKGFDPLDLGRPRKRRRS